MSLLFLFILTVLTLHVIATIVRRQTVTCSEQQLSTFMATNLSQVCQDPIHNFTVEKPWKNTSS